MRGFRREAIIVLFQLEHLFLFLLYLFISTSQSIKGLTVLSVEVPNLNLGKETSNNHIVDALTSEIIQPFYAEWVRTEDDLMMNI